MLTVISVSTDHVTIASTSSRGDVNQMDVCAKSLESGQHYVSALRKSSYDSVLFPRCENGMIAKIDLTTSYVSFAARQEKPHALLSSSRSLDSMNPGDRSCIFIDYLLDDEIRERKLASLSSVSRQASCVVAEIASY